MYGISKTSTLLFLCIACIQVTLVHSQKLESSYENRNDVEAVTEEQKICVETPQEFADAFAAREPRCVAKHLIGRVFGGRDASSIFLQVNSKPATFYSGYDALERYLRVGYPETFGYFTQSRAATISQPNFPGLESASNGFGLLQIIGYDPEYIEIDRVYVLSVFDARDIDTLVKSQNGSEYPFHADIGPIQPTWDAVKEYYEWVYDDLELVIPDQAMDILKNMSFMTLTGCPARCSYVSKAFPSENVTTAVITQDRVDYNTCPPAEQDAIQVTPTATDLHSTFCDGYEGREWKPKVEAMDSVFTARFCEPKESVKAAKLLRDALENTTDSIEQAQWFRAFLVQSCIGTFSPLFSGNGFTYTGDSSLWEPTATEYIVSPFNISELSPEAKVDIYFCINGLNGGKPDANGTCPIPVMPGRGKGAEVLSETIIAPTSAMSYYSLVILLGTSYIYTVFM